ncbi:hypothetical protein H0H87_002488 [Tephrocybe sp. NHM501043]|nr:hypothetical protein H0H87_002488 [Tephrocybe sp. NHM501043]
MHAIQDNEMEQLRELTTFVDLEINFVEQYLNVLKDAKAQWYDESSVVHVVPPRRTTAPPHVFSHSVKDTSDSDSETSRHSKRSGSISSKPSSRPASRASRKRADSGATVGEKDEKDKDKASKRMSVAGWASSAVDSVTGRSKKNKDKDKFASLYDDATEQDVDEDDMRSSPKKPSTFHSLTRKLSKSKDTSPRPPAKILKPPSLQEKKLVRATHSFTGAADELSFIAGEEIVVLNEVLDDWWMGELNGKKGLFPTTYVEPIASKPVLPQRPGGSRRAAALSTVFSPTEEVHHLSADDDSISYSSTDFDDDDDFGKQPLSAHHASPFISGPSDDASIISSLVDDEDDKLHVPFFRTTNFDSDDTFQVTNGSSFSSPAPQLLASVLTSPPPLPRRATTSDVVASGATTPSKKAPPPPPPRRSTNTALGPTPPVPERLYKKAPTPASSISSHDRSPFESVTELSTPDTVEGGCGNFKQNPFQAKGMCNNCFQFHG